MINTIGLVWTEVGKVGIIYKFVSTFVSTYWIGEKYVLQECLIL